MFVMMIAVIIFKRSLVSLLWDIFAQSCWILGLGVLLTSSSFSLNDMLKGKKPI